MMKYTAAMIAVSCSLLAVISAMSVPCPRADCGAPEAGPDCQNVTEFRAGKSNCYICRICMDEPAVRPDTLACPDYPFWFDVESQEPVCNQDADCATGKKCCIWGRSKHCLTGIDIIPKPGSCPAPIPLPNGAAPCIADYGGCQHDSQCTGTQKCCENGACGYKDCQDVADPEPPVTACTEIGCGLPPPSWCQNLTTVRPNGAGCEPECLVCADTPPTTVLPPVTNVSRTHLACPRSPYWFDTYRPEPLCNMDEDCGATEKCCYWGGNRHCLGGLDMAPKQGTCPSVPAPPPGVGNPNCRQDYVGCSYDSECIGDRKCCQDAECGYKTCAYTPQLPICTEIGCGPAPGPECQTIAFVRPNGAGCEPECRVCADPPATNTTTTTTTTVAPLPSNITRENLACPDYPYWFDVESQEPACNQDTDCATDRKCCLWGRTKHCLSGIDITPKEGSCPAPSGPGNGNDPCIADYVGCSFDSQCSGVEKCCRNSQCGYNQCINPLQLAGQLPGGERCTEIGCGPAPGPECQTFRFVRPNGPGCDPECRVCADPPTTTTAATTTTQKPLICQMTWELICPEGQEVGNNRRGRRTFVNYYRPMCRYERVKKCY